MAPSSVFGDSPAQKSTRGLPLQARFTYNQSLKPLLTEGRELAVADLDHLDSLLGLGRSLCAPEHETNPHFHQIVAP